MLSTSNQRKILDAFEIFIKAIEPFAQELPTWERGAFRLNNAIIRCLLQNDRLEASALETLQTTVDHLRNTHGHKRPAPIAIMEPADKRKARTPKRGAEELIAAINNIIENGDESQIREMFNEAKALAPPDDHKLQADLAEISHIMGWTSKR